ncbi:MAG: AAA family ATPase [Isosphaerales bacterium]
MKLTNLNLRAVGPFTGVVLDLSAGEQGLHLIYGPNEAGKTSALRALSHLLFGFPHLSADNFVHPNDQLRVGGKLRQSDGEELEFVRRRGKGKTLRGPDDSSVVPDDRLARFLGGMNQDTFKTLFGIDHERLTQAGEEIRTGQGHLGELLFAAGAGLAGLRQAQATLKGELDGLFLPRGQNQRINKLKTEFDEAKEELKRLQLPSEYWQQHDSTYREATTAAEQLREQLRAARVDQARLKRIKSAIPLVARRRRLTQELAELGDVIPLRDDFGTESRSAQDRLRRAEQTITQSRAVILEIDAQLAHLASPRGLLDAADEIELLQERKGAVVKASLDRARLENFLDDTEHQARQVLRELGRSTDLDEADTLRLRTDEPAIIHMLGQQSAELRGQAEPARRAIARYDDQITRQEKELAGLEQPREVEPLRRAVRQARKAGDLDASLTEARGKLARAEKKAATALAQLPGWSRSAEDLQLLAVPLNATLDQYESQFQETTRQRQASAERLAAEDDSIRQLETRLQSLELQQDVPTEEALLAARNRREEGWRLVKLAWLDSAPEGDDTAVFLAEFAPGGTLAAAYEQTVQRTDAIADRLHREADRVARKAELLAQLGQHRASRSSLQEDSRLIEDLHAHTQRDWNLVVVPLGLEAEARTPAELRAWLRRREDLLLLLEKVEEARQGVESLDCVFAKHHSAVRRAQDEVGEASSTSSCDLAESLEQAETAIKRQDDLAQKRAKLEAKLADARSERANARLSLQAAEAKLDAWRTDWSTQMARIGLEAGAAPEQAEIVLTRISDLFKVLDSRRDFLSRIRGIDRDADQFARDVVALVARVAPDVADGPSDEQARELANRLNEAQKATILTDQRQREDGNLRAAEAERDQERIHLERLCKEAGCTKFDQHPEAERRSQDRARLIHDRASCEEQLMTAAAGADLNSFAAEAEKADPDGLDTCIVDLDENIAAREQELRRLDQTIGTERAELARMDGGDRAAETAELAQTILARFHGDVARYATLKLAAAVLNRGIERYRDKNQGPILARAGGLFAALTAGSFAQLQIDDDGNGRSVLKGVRPDGRLVGVEGMSDGSHDQLYLALRLASLESWLQSHEPIPFVVDDILLNFDDIRATAALGALAELSRRTQVLFFTHHRHIIDLARTHLPRDVVFTHELPGPRDSSTNSQIRLGEEAAK